MSSTAQPVTAFVMAGGGSLGAVEVGMLQELLAEDVRPDFIVGASAGAINGAFFASEPTRSGVDKLRAIWLGLRRQDVFPFDFRNLFSVLTGRGHLVESHGLRRLLERHLPYADLQGAAIPIHVVASDMVTGEEVLLSQGPVVEAVLASAAIPGVFPPVQYDGRMLVDGGVASNTPISAAVRLGAQRVIVLPTGFACALKQMPTSAIPRAMHALSLLVARQLVHDADRYADAVELRIVPTLCPLENSPYDYSATAQLIERAAASTRRWLDRGGMDRVGVPGALRDDHTH